MAAGQKLDLVINIGVFDFQGVSANNVKTRLAKCCHSCFIIWGPGHLYYKSWYTDLRKVFSVV